MHGKIITHSFITQQQMQQPQCLLSHNQRKETDRIQQNNIELDSCVSLFIRPGVLLSNYK